MKLNQLRQLIREEIRQVIVEAKEMRRPMGDLNKLKGKTIKSFTHNKSKYGYTVVFTDKTTIFINGNESKISNPTAYKGKTIKRFNSGGNSFTVDFTDNTKLDIANTNIIWSVEPEAPKVVSQPTQTPKPTPSYSKLAKEASDLYEKMVNTLDSYDLDSDAVDDEMESIVKKVGYTPEQKKKPRNKFTFGEHPEFETLTDNQLTKIIPFLKAVIKSGGYEIYDDWNGTKIVRDDDA